MRLRIVFYVSIVVMFGAVHGADGAIVARETFDSYTAPGGLNGKNEGFGWTSSWSAFNAATVQNGVIPNLSPVPPFGNSARIADGTGSNDGNSNNAVQRSFSAQTAATLYVGFVVDTATWESNDFVQFYVNNSSGVSDGSGGSGGIRNVFGSPYFVRADGFDNNVDTTISHTGSPAQIVLKLSKTGAAHAANYDRVEIFVNQFSEGTPDAFSVANTGTSTLSTFHIRTVSLESGDTVFFDNLVVATSFEEAIIPEPSTYLVFASLAVCFSLASWWQKRKRAV